MRIGLTKKQAVKIGKVAGWVAASSAIGGLLTLIAEDPMLFGVFTPIVNVLLVTVQQLLKKEDPEATE